MNNALEVTIILSSLASFFTRSGATVSVWPENGDATEILLDRREPTEVGDHCAYLPCPTKWEIRVNAKLVGEVRVDPTQPGELVAKATATDWLSEPFMSNKMTEWGGDPAIVKMGLTPA